MAKWIYDIMNTKDDQVHKVYFCIYVLQLCGTQLVVSLSRGLDLETEIKWLAIFMIISFIFSNLVQCQARIEYKKYLLKWPGERHQNAKSGCMSFVTNFLVAQLNFTYIRSMFGLIVLSYDIEQMTNPNVSYFVTFTSNITYIMLIALTFNLQYNMAYYPWEIPRKYKISQVLYKIGSSCGQIFLMTGICGFYQGTLQGFLQKSQNHMFYVYLAISTFPIFTAAWFISSKLEQRQQTQIKKEQLKE